MLGRAAAAEFDMPGERCGSRIRVERRRRAVSEPREHVDAAGDETSISALYPNDR